MTILRFRSFRAVTLPGLGLGPCLGPCLGLCLVLALAASGCASKKFVRTELAAGVEASESRTGERMTELEGDIERNQDSIRAAEGRLDAQDQEIAKLSRAAQDALDRALEAGKLAEGKLIAELVLSADDVRFPVNKAELSPEAKAAIDQFAAPLAKENSGIYIEIQGHTDNSGSESYNMKLGEQRAEAVRRYLNMEHSFPLHRLGVISYGESAPSYDNATREGRNKNRRVVLVVLR